MLTIDERCQHPSCDDKNIYRMVGRCGNCGTEPILFLITEGHDAPKSSFMGAKCPVCGCDDAYTTRLATPDEIPAA